MRQGHAVACPLPTAIGLNREQAAAFVGVGVTLFDQLVVAGKMPSPRIMSTGRLVYDVAELEAAFRAVPHKHEATADNDAGLASALANNPWDRNGKATR